MNLKTYSFVKTFVQDKLDLRDEDFITDAEMATYFEEALKYCEAEIHKLNIEDQYFVAVAPLALVPGKSDYALPSNIYGNKVLRLVYSTGTAVANIRRLTKMARFEQAEVTNRYSTSVQGNLTYMLVNSDPRVGTRVRFFPVPNETTSVVSTTGTTVSGSQTVTVPSTYGMAAGYYLDGTSIVSGTRILSVDSATVLTMTEPAVVSATVDLDVTEPRLICWYIRSVSIPSVGTDYIDFPEFWHFIAQHVVVNCLKKEIGNSRLAVEIETLKELKEQMHSTLANMVPDQDDEIEKDVSHYNDMGAEF